MQTLFFYSYWFFYPHRRTLHLTLSCHWDLFASSNFPIIELHTLSHSRVSHVRSYRSLLTRKNNTYFRNTPESLLFKYNWTMEFLSLSCWTLHVLLIFSFSFVISHWEKCLNFCHTYLVWASRIVGTPTSFAIIVNRENFMMKICEFVTIFSFT